MTGLFSNMASSARAMAARLSPTRFMKREDGTVTAFAVLIFVLMVGVSGIAIDVMRYETQRAQLQYTLDRAILAAASLTQPYDPEGVVRDYFEISGLEGYRLDVRVEQGLNFRRVHAYAELEVRSLFMQLFGVRLMTSPAVGAAEERVHNIEVSMVLDISGSMGSNNRMTNLRPAARDFVTEVLSANELEGENLVTVSIVPYNGRVNSGDLIESVFTFSNANHSASNCARFDLDDFNTTTINPDEAIDRIAHWDRSGRNSDRAFQNPHCQTNGYGAILPWQHEEGPLHAHIDSLGTGGWTAIDLGMNWAVGLLDPAAGSAVTGLIASGDVHQDFAGRPAAFDDDESIKVVVLMTDGDNTNQYDLVDEFRSGPAPIFRHAGLDLTMGTDDDRYSVWWEDYGTDGAFWVPTGDPRDTAGSWESEPFGGFAAYGMTAVGWDNDRYADRDPDLPNLLGEFYMWPELFAQYTARYISNEWLEVPASQSGQWGLRDRLRNNSDENYSGWDSAGGRPQADSNLMAICDAANAAGIFVFSIGFEAPARGQEVMQYCATTPAHYYDVDGLEINQAFDSIARTINQLRLIQ